MMHYMLVHWIILSSSAATCYLVVFVSYCKLAPRVEHAEHADRERRQLAKAMRIEEEQKRVAAHV